MQDFTHRSYQLELLDDDRIPQEALFQNLRELDFINTYLSGHDVVLSGLRKFKDCFQESTSICEIGSGGGDNLRAILRVGRKKKWSLSLTGVDLKADCIQFAEVTDMQKLASNPISYQCNDYRLANFEQQPDIIFNSLFCHHFKDEALIEMLRWMHANAKKGFYICDLHRNPIAYYAIKLLTSLFSKSYLVKNDAPLSVLRGFSKNEWISLLERAGIQNYSIEWKWAFRWLIVVRTNQA